jgi:nucleotide-binding universal stress UspA family protein
MYRYKRILVGLTLTEEDVSTIRYAAVVSRMAKAQTVYFAHVTETLDWPKELTREHPQSFRPVDEREQQQMRTLVEHYFDGHGDAEVVYEIREGSVVAEMLRLARQKDVDLIVVGQRADVHNRGRIPEKLARKALCSVLIVPEGANSRIERILVPLDFSEHSRDALEVATAIASARGLRKVYCLHSYNVPSFYYYEHYQTGTNYEELAEIMRRNAEEHYSQFLAGVDLKGVDAVPINQLSQRPSSSILHVTREQNIDLVVMGTRGKTAAAEVLLGSVTERSIHACTKPLIAVKKKGARMGLLKAIAEL